MSNKKVIPGIHYPFPDDLPLAGRIDLLLGVLSPQQRIFVEEALTNGLDFSKAARIAYNYERAAIINLRPKRTSSKVLVKIMSEIAEQIGVDVEYVIRGLKRESDGEGGDTNSAARIRALGLLGDHLGMFKRETGVNGTIKVEYVNDWRGPTSSTEEDE